MRQTVHLTQTANCLFAAFGTVGIDSRWISFFFFSKVELSGIKCILPLIPCIKFHAVFRFFSSPSFGISWWYKCRENAKNAEQLIIWNSILAGIKW